MSASPMAMSAGTSDQKVPSSGVFCPTIAAITRTATITTAATANVMICLFFMEKSFLQVSCIGIQKKSVG